MEMPYLFEFAGKGFIIFLIALGVYFLLRALYHQRFFSPFQIVVYAALLYKLQEAWLDEITYPWYIYAIIGGVAVSVVIYTLWACRLRSILALPLNLAGGIAGAYSLVVLKMNDDPARPFMFWGAVILAVVLWLRWGSPKCDSNKPRGKVTGPAIHGDTVSLKDFSPEMQREIMRNGRAPMMVDSGSANTEQEIPERSYEDHSQNKTAEERLAEANAHWVGDDRWEDGAGRVYNDMGYEQYDTEEKSPYRRMDDQGE